MSYFLTCAIALWTAALLYILAAAKYRRNRNPPGPKPLPLIGNVLDFPQDKPWETFSRWTKQYGEIIYMNLLGTPIVVLNSLDASIDLFEKRSAKYSGRPRFIMLNELVGIDYTFDRMSYTPRWRRYRRLFHQHFNEKASLKYWQPQEKYILPFLQRLLAEPENFFSHIRLLFGETILDVIYNIKKEDNNRFFIQLAEDTIAIELQTLIPGQFLVDVFPPLKHIPSWFPGAKFKRLALKWRQVGQDLKFLPFAFAKKKMEEGNAEPSVLMSMLDGCNGEAVEEQKGCEEPLEEVAKGCAAIAYVAGSDTSSSVIQAFFMAMANYQDVQKAAQKEIDSLLGSPLLRLPTAQDKGQLPFVAAIIKELWRWHNVSPLITHVLTEDDEYNGYTFRKGTVVMSNVWHILRDPEIFPDPLTFNPRRWLIDTPEGLKPNTALPDSGISFGLGRRICPGRHFAANSLFMTICSVLACYDIKPLDAQGQPTDRIKEVFTNGPLLYPAPFKVSITPRSSNLDGVLKGLDSEESLWLS